MVKTLESLYSRMRLCLPILALLGLCSLQANAGEAPLAADINQLQAAFVFNFSKYFTWPNTALITHKEIFTICVDTSLIANNQFASLVGQTTQDRKIVLIPTPAAAEEIARQCLLWYVDTSSYLQDKAHLLALSNSSVLTVSDAKDSLASGVVIELTVVNNKIQFRINNELIAKKNLSASAFLLRLAQP